MRAKIKAMYFDVEGVIVPARYSEDRLALAIHDPLEPRAEVLSVNLVGYGIEQPAGHVHVGTYSQYTGLVEAVEKAGLATRVGDSPVEFGGFDASAWLMKLSDEVMAVFEVRVDA